ncbi:MAG: Co2+/Mg2+ efflux protein ApaG [Bacteroidetes bacterium]|uniref:Co2+/Mg2+ efflux protein ApaG n=1 Tax=Phaeocystidibacter marisrubri TaxID=1577780 RepID=A0A6L3ZGT7_9FLAO|nr:Co2+/Mg2+ efflux protein ApaG [Phaeocystidibacter marisrubri]KAB2817236.1 Co2+/Mg2+ efflux protein ApaG [Phaeocystidibacter marisrubri]TNE28341.1 MAG: Co2+/Mg2+ efflux protein ApaG [Bacteroidota bacterium]GGH76306.1 protein ApaG [Phaeocystidibacter marisrubri]
MVTQVTSGIRVSVETGFEGRFFSKHGPLYVFTYDVTIENQSSETVQLLGRHWFIYDTGEGPSEVEGNGVIGKQPVIAPGEVHTYRSGCHLRASIGAMRGVYNMVRLNSSERFEVNIPTFQFFASPRLN